MSDRRRASIVDREQAVTPFGTILLKLCDDTAALGAALVDHQGETVDYAGVADSYEIRVAAAEWRLVLSMLATSRVPNWPETREIIVRSAKRSFAVVDLPEGYAVVLQLGLRRFGISRRAISQAVRAICHEAGIELPRELAARDHWSRVEVKATEEDRKKPDSVWVDSGWCRLDVLGRYEASHLERGEVGFRARMPNGAEINLVRERRGVWYAEDLPT